ncbi:DUF2919 domain-containing protein [Salmonella enterica subsp. enterica]|nr:DUF2919 family protein [Salmonella enterica]EBV2359549.1 hypothetical protein [Salmonella enterica subsp. enterica serovar Ago]EDR1738741.1 DUF2919 domain-containing protein [Salmonella enterica subsp. diarizonae]EHC7824870.1 DUF2919 domain-containing protein [Salmonella enterica subsp. enterica serovar Braenderup]EHG9651917.1 DUF2919 domain-containing protein [Salmonella enterica subsp. enterica serovar Monschaui]
MKEQNVMAGTRSPGRRYRAEDYDDEGNLKASLWMWPGVAWLLLPWWLTAAGVMSGSTPLMAEVLYPTTADAVLSLVTALPVVALCAVYPLRGRIPRASLLTYGAVFTGQVVELFRTGSVLLRETGWGHDGTDLLLSCLCVDFAVLLGMLLSPRLWTVFGWRR